MSGSLNQIYNNASFALHLHTKTIADLQEQVSTGSRVNRISDSPSVAYQLLGLKSQQRSLDSYINHISEILSTLNITSTVIQEVSSSLAEIRTQLTQVTGGTYQSDSRQRIAEGIDDILEQIVSLANTKDSDQYLFGGSNTASAPYIVERNDGKISRVIYQGGSENRTVEVSTGLKSSALYVGDDIFRSKNRSEVVFVGDTGARAAEGTSSITGDAWLTVTHDGSNYKLSIDDGATYVTVPLGGEPNQTVKDSRTGQVLYVDSTQINSTGVEMVSAPGTYDVFSVLISIRDILQNDKDLSDSQSRQFLDNSLTALEEVSNLLVQSGVKVGSKISFLGNLKDSLQNRSYDTDDELTRLQEADIAQVVVDLSRCEVLYEMSLSVAARLMSMSLLDFIT